MKSSVTKSIATTHLYFEQNTGTAKNSIIYSLTKKHVAKKETKTEYRTNNASCLLFMIIDKF